MPKKKKGAFDQAMDNFFDVANVMRKNLHSAGAAYGKAHQSAVNSIARPVSSAVKSAQQASKDTRVRPFAAHSAPCPLIVCRDHVAICYFYNVPSEMTPRRNPVAPSLLALVAETGKVIHMRGRHAGRDFLRVPQPRGSR